MAPKFCTGYLRLSLVTCPVALQPATSESQKVRFHTLNRATGESVVSRYVDAVTGKPVNDDDEVKGYAVSDDKFVLFEDEELAAVGLEAPGRSTSTCSRPTTRSPGFITTRATS